MIKCLMRLNRVILTLRLRIGVGIKNWFTNWTSIKPEAATAYFV